MELEINNLIAHMQGRTLHLMQKADALIEFNKLCDYVNDLEILQPTQFKVATEDSCVVLEVPDAYDDYYRDANGGTKDYFDAMVIWNKAPSISQDRLELNKMRVENERLKGLNDEFEKHMISQNDLITKQQLKFRQTNKQLKEYKEVVKKVVREGYKLKAQHHNSKWKEALENAELLSKLNKD